MQQGSRYDYSKAGFDAFLSRSIDTNGQDSLSTDSNAQSRAVAFDRQQVSGVLGDTWRAGGISINGQDNNIILSDGTNNRLLLGEQKGGF